MTKTLSIAIISSTPYAGPWSQGVRNLIRRIIHDFSLRGAEVTVIGPESPGDVKLEEDGERVIQVPTLHKWPRVIRQSRLWFASGQAVGQLDPPPDVLLLMASVSSALGLRTMLLKKLSGKPLAIYVTGLSRPRLGYRWGMSAERVFVGNEFLQRWFPGAGIVPPVLPVNLMHEVLSTERQDGKFIVLFLGSFEPERGVEYLLSALSIAKEKAERGIKLILAWNGVGASNYANIQRLIDALGIRSIVDLRGQVNTSKVYREADILVIPRASPERMASPVRIVEALSMHKPMVVTRICGMENLIEGCGIAVEPRDAEGLARAILDLANNESLRKHMQDNCARLSKRFDSRVTLDMLYSELQMIAAK